MPLCICHRWWVWKRYTPKVRVLQAAVRFSHPRPPWSHPRHLASTSVTRFADVRETHALVVQHIKNIRDVPGLEEAMVVLSLESNLAFEAHHLLHAVQASGTRRWVALQEGAGQSLGWLTTNDRKESMMMQTRDALAVGAIVMASGLVSLSMSQEEAKKKLKDELSSFAVIVEAARTPFGKPKKTYSGKIGGRQDDRECTRPLSVRGPACPVLVNTNNPFPPCTTRSFDLSAVGDHWKQVVFLERQI